MATHRRTGAPSHNRTNSAQINQRAQLANAYQELGKELGSEKLKVVGGYTLGRVIGEGSYGAVYIATHRLTGTRCAIKKIPKNMTGQLTREIHHHRSLHHRHILQLYEIIATESHIWLVSELCTGGELFDYLVERGRLLEGEARRIFGELTVAVGTIHRKGTVHRDLKLENVFLNGFCGVKLGDLGFAREWSRGSKLLETFCGTTGYASPEMLQGHKYAGEEADIWSLGIILYTLLCGGLPFDDDDEDTMKALIVKGEYEEPEWLSDEAKDLIKGILQLEPTSRLSIEGVLSHPWFKKRIVDLPADAAAQNGQSGAGAVTPFLNTPETNMAGMTSYFQDSLMTPVSQLGQGQHADSHVGLSPLSSPKLEPTVPGTVANTLQGYRYPTSKLANEAIPRELLDGEGDASDTSAGTRTATSSDAGHTSTSATTAATTAEGDESTDLFDSGKSMATQDADDVYLHSNESQSTIKKSPAPSVTFAKPSVHILESQFEEEEQSGMEGTDHGGMEGPDSRRHSAISFDEHGYHMAVHSRTPARTKRRSVSSSVASECRPSMLRSNSFATNALPIVNYLEQLTEASPVFFSAIDEKELLRSLELLGFDVGQMKHSVTSDACDSSAATWWMLRAKQQQKEEYERYQLEGLPVANQPDQPPRPVTAPPTTASSEERPMQPPRKSLIGDVFGSEPVARSPVTPEQMAPVPSIELGLPIRSSGDARRPSLATDYKAVTTLGLPSHVTQQKTFNVHDDERSSSSRSVPTSLSHQPPSVSPPLVPSGMEPLKPADESNTVASSPGSPSRRTEAGKVRSSSISMLQRATSALSTGLVRKKSEEKLLDDASGKETSDVKKSPTKLIKTPPLGRRKDSIGDIAQAATVETHDTPGPSSGAGIPPSSSYGTLSGSTVSLDEAPSVGINKAPKNGKRESLLMTFRSWWNEDRRKRKRNNGPSPVVQHHGLNHTPSLRSQHMHVVKRTTVVQRRSPADTRPHIGSRRSSSVNSRRSSVTSLHIPLMDLPSGSPMDPYTLLRRQSSRRSTGSRTPTSEFGEFGAGSRPTSVRSMQLHGSASQRTLHGKAHSISSTGSRTPTRSPGGRNSHYRNSSTSSARARVRSGPHHRSASTATNGSNRSGGSSRRSSGMPDERGGESGNEYESDDMFVHAWRKRSVEERLANPTQLIAKRTRSPLSSQFILAHMGKPRPLPPIRDVFADKGKNTDGQGEDDWTSDEEEAGTFAGGLGQCSTNANRSGGAMYHDSPVQKSSGSFSSMPMAFSRGSGRSGSSSKSTESKQKSSSSSTTVSSGPVMEQPADNRARGRGVMPTNRPADITEEEEPEE